MALANPEPLRCGTGRHMRIAERANTFPCHCEKSSTKQSRGGSSLRAQRSNPAVSFHYINWVLRPWLWMTPRASDCRAKPRNDGTSLPRATKRPPKGVLWFCSTPAFSSRQSEVRETTLRSCRVRYRLDGNRNGNGRKTKAGDR